MRESWDRVQLGLPISTLSQPYTNPISTLSIVRPILREIYSQGCCFEEVATCIENRKVRIKTEPVLAIKLSKWTPDKKNYYCEIIEDNQILN